MKNRSLEVGNEYADAASKIEDREEVEEDGVGQVEVEVNVEPTLHSTKGCCSSLLSGRSD